MFNHVLMNNSVFLWPGTFPSEEWKIWLENYLPPRSMGHVDTYKEHLTQGGGATNIKSSEPGQWRRYSDQARGWTTDSRRVQETMHGNLDPPSNQFQIIFHKRSN